MNDIIQAESLSDLGSAEALLFNYIHQCKDQSKAGTNTTKFMAYVTPQFNTDLPSEIVSVDLLFVNALLCPRCGVLFTSMDYYVPQTIGLEAELAHAWLEMGLFYLRQRRIGAAQQALRIALLSDITNLTA